MNRVRFFVSILAGIFLAGSFIIIFFLARGYRFNIAERSIEATGMIAVTSIPEGAAVFLDGKLTSATNTTISQLSEGTYRLRMEKQGYHSWEKDLEVQKELVTTIKALLVPLFPELKPLTHTGIKSCYLSPDGTKIAYTVKEASQQGIWTLDLNERPFNLSNKPSFLLADTSDRLYSAAEITWSPDSSSLLLQLSETTNSETSKESGQDLELEASSFLLEVLTRDLKPVTNPSQLKKTWEKENVALNKKLLENLPIEFATQVSLLSEVSWSPDYNKLLYKTKNGEFKIIDLRELELSLKQLGKKLNDDSLLQEFEKSILTFEEGMETKVFWYPDSEHLLVLDQSQSQLGSGTLSLIEIDGKNKMPIFTGTISNSVVFPFPDGSKVAILTTFNPESGQYNLYSINLR